MASARSLRGLDVVNVFMADVKDGVGVYLSVYLLAEQKWDPSRIGIVVAIPWLVAIVAQTPVGAFIDKTRAKRILLVLASAIVAFTCVTVVLLPKFAPIAAAQLTLGVAQAIFPPCVAAITLGMVGHKHLDRRIGRNESFNHAGNMIAAVLAIFIGWYISYEGIFYFSIVQCVLLIVGTLMIRESDIDHELARAAPDASLPGASAALGIKGLLKDRNISCFILAICLWNVANGAMLPLLGQKLGLQNVRHSALYLSICIIIAQTVMVVVAPLASRLAQVGRKRIFLIAFALVPLRALLFAVIENKYGLIALQVIDGLGAGIYGVLLILMMADLGKGTGHFNLLQGTTYAALGIGVAFSSILSGFVLRQAGFGVAFATLAGMGVLATLFFAKFVKEPQRLETVAS